VEKIGDVLRNTRQVKGISLREVEEATKIRQRYLEALENSDYEQIPGRVYALGFLRNYARFLGLDAQELIERFKAEYPVKEDLQPVEEIGSSIHGLASRKKNLLLLILGVFIFLWSVNWLYNFCQSYFSESPAPSTTEPGLVTEPQPDNQQEPVAPVPRIEGVEVTIKATGDCWTDVVIDGTSSFAGTLRAGDEKVFQGQEEIKITLGSAGVVELTVNGQGWPFLGKPGDVVRVTFKPDSVPPDVGEGDK